MPRRSPRLVPADRFRSEGFPESLIQFAIKRHGDKKTWIKAGYAFGHSMEDHYSLETAFARDYLTASLMDLNPIWHVYLAKRPVPSPCNLSMAHPDGSPNQQWLPYSADGARQSTDVINSRVWELLDERHEMLVQGAPLGWVDVWLNATSDPDPSRF